MGEPKKKNKNRLPIRRVSPPTPRLVLRDVRLETSAKFECVCRPAQLRETRSETIHKHNNDNNDNNDDYVEVLYRSMGLGRLSW